MNTTPTAMKLVTANDLHDAEFHTRLFGYDPNQVDQLLDAAELSMRILYRKIRELEGTTHAAHS